MNTLDMIFIIIFITVITFLLLLWPRTTGIPKIIWSFWDGEQPPIVKACIDSWKRMAPDYEIRILDKESTKDIQTFKRSSDSIQRYSDFVRLDVLSRHGGVWMDASVYLAKPLDWIQDGSDFVGYKYDSSIQSNADLPVVVSYFFACKKGSKYVNDWYEEFKLFDTFDTVNDYLNSLEIDYSKVKGPEYLTVYISSMVVRSKNNYENMNLCSIENETSFNIRDFCDDKIDPENRLIKIDNTQRTYLENMKCNKISV